MQSKDKKPRRHTRSLAQYTKQNRGMLLLCTLFAAGVLCATLLLGSTDESIRAYLLRMIDGFAHQRLTQSLQTNFLSALMSAMMFVGMLFLCGFCAISQPVIIAMPFFRGLGVGFSVAALYSYYGIQAINFAVIYIICALLSTAAMLICCIEALKLSVGIFRVMRTGERSAFYPVPHYLAKFAAAILLTVFAAVMEAILYSVFANYVVLG